VYRSTFDVYGWLAQFPVAGTGQGPSTPLTPIDLDISNFFTSFEIVASKITGAGVGEVIFNIVGD
jgi:hypothetical protein